MLLDIFKTILVMIAFLITTIIFMILGSLNILIVLIYIASRLGPIEFANKINLSQSQLEYIAPFLQAILDKRKKKKIILNEQNTVK